MNAVKLLRPYRQGWRVVAKFRAWGHATEFERVLRYFQVENTHQFRVVQSDNWYVVEKRRL